jgi:hypothetical protein
LSTEFTIFLLVHELCKPTLFSGAILYKTQPGKEKKSVNPQQLRAKLPNFVHYFAAELF